MRISSAGFSEKPCLFLEKALPLFARRAADSRLFSRVFPSFSKFSSFFLSLCPNKLPMRQTANPTEIRFDKAECGVDFLINTGTGMEHLLHYASDKEYVTDFFEFIFFEEGGGHVWIEHKRYDVTPNCIVFLSPYQRHKWRLEADAGSFRFLIFQEDFLHNFLADKYFTYRLLYCYPNGTPPLLLVSPDDTQRYLMLLKEIKQELRRTISDSEQILRSLLFQVPA